MQLVALITPVLLLVAALSTASIPQTVSCEGTYPKHLQGVCVDNEFIYWCFTTELVKTDRSGKRLKQIPVADHHGDMCLHAGKLYVAVNLGRFNDPLGNANSWVYVYDSKTLQEVARHETQEVFHGAGGIGVRGDHFFVVGGLPNGVQENFIYEYDSDWKFVQKHVLKSGHTDLGIQTATFAHDRWWFGCYGKPQVLLIADSNFQMLGRYEFNCSLGISGLPDGQLLVATGKCEADRGCSGAVGVAVPDDARGLRMRNETSKDIQ